MKKAICYFSGAGNSQKAATTLAHYLQDCEVYGMPKVLNGTVMLDETTILGLVFPVYFYGPPAMVRRFILEYMKSHQLPVEYLFVVITYGALPLSTLSITEQLLSEAGYAASYVDKVKMVDTYVPLYRLPPKQRQEEINARAIKQLHTIAAHIDKGESRVASWLPFQRLFRRNWERTLEHRGADDSRFLITDECTGCALCAQTCPAENIVMEEDRPRFLHRCEQCFGCYHRCPTHAIALDPPPRRGYSWYEYV